MLKQHVTNKGINNWKFHQLLWIVTKENVDLTNLTNPNRDIRWYKNQFV